MYYLLLPLLLFSTVVFAQDDATSSEHLTFKGVPIDGTLSEFAAKLRAKGLSYKGSEDGVAFFEGDFAGYKDCEVLAIAFNDLVAKVGVAFPVDDNWPQLSHTYNRLQELLSEKYGDPMMDVEEFTKSMPDGGFWKMSAINDGEFEIYTTYSLDKGTIQLTMVGEPVRRGRVVLLYFDEINSESVESQIIDDL